MERADIKETNLDFDMSRIAEREETNRIVIHHTGSGEDTDSSAAQIHEWHRNHNGWAGIGYHFVIRKDGTIERGRPIWAMGAHAEGANYDSIGIHLSGDFTYAEPTEDQIERTAMLIANLCEDYDIPTDRNHILGHREVGESSCPGERLFAKLDLISGKANFYRYGSPEEVAARESAWRDDLKKIRQELSDEEQIWKFLKDKGLNDFAAAGVMGNLYAESGLSSTNLENYYESSLGMTDEEYTAAVDDGSYGNFVHDKAGYGLAQWTYYSRKQNLLDYARTTGASIGNLAMQLEFLWGEMQGYGSMMETLAGASSVLEASNAMLLDFERPADQSEAVQAKRAGFGQDFFNRYAGQNTEETEATEKEGSEMRYNKLADMPEWAKPTIQKMIGKGFLGGGGAKDADGNPVDLDLSIDMIRVFVVNDRAKLYG